jgi:peptidyl-prolyl isomerase E (cyclophilin E)
MNSTSTPISHKRTLYIGGLDDNVTEDLLRAAFIPFGEILSINIPMDQFTKKHRGFGFIEYETIEEAHSAVDNMHNSELFGKTITCVTAKASTIGSIGKPVWADENYMEQTEKDQTNQIQETANEEVEQTKSKIKTSEVQVNAPKRLKITEPSPIPPGFVRCKGCGGWGTGLVKDSGYCAHCSRILPSK